MDYNITAEICPVKYGRKAICTIISDDGRKQTVENLSKLAVEFGCKITVAQVVKYIENLDIWKGFEQNGNIEFISHSYTHQRLDNEELSDDELEHEIMEAKQFMEANFQTDQIVFIPPNNQLSDKAYIICKKHFYAIRRWRRLYNFLSPEPGKDWLQWLNLGCKGIRDVETTDERNRWIDDVLLQKKWLIEMWHDVEMERNVCGGYQCITVEEARQHLNYVKEQSCKKVLWVAPFTEAVKYIQESQSCSLQVSKITKNRWRVFLSSGIAERDYRFDMPLTIKIIVPRKIKKIYGLFENTKLKLEIQNDMSIQIELRPGESFELLLCRFF